MNEPLAIKMRPESISEIVGQQHLVGKNKILSNLVNNKRLFSMILYGKPGIGKTTIACALVHELGLRYRMLNATINNKRDFDVVIEEAKMYGGMVVIMDEIHRLNKDKQDLLLPYLENGLITLIGMTTSNPYHKINPAIRSRCQIFELHELNEYPFIELAEAWEDNLYERVGAALDAGEEGMVIKKKTGIYEPGKRPDTNLKAKKVDFADAVIIGFESPTIFYYGTEIENWQYWIQLNEDDMEWKLPVGCYYGQEGDATDGYYRAVTKPYYMGWNNARIQIGAYDENGNLVNIGTIHSGISDEMKQSMSENPELWLNKVCKIQCMEKDNKEHTIRHGFYKGLHDDKNAKDCTLSAIF